MNIVFLTVGGTIDKVYFDANSKYEIGDSHIEEILKDAKVNLNFSIKSILKKDSLDMTHKDRLRVADAVKAEKNDKIIITHGTDTMIETAQTLRTIKNKTIILTGSMEPAIFKSSDAVFNLGFAVCAVQSLSHGVYIAISGQIFSPDNAIKNHTMKIFEKKK